MKNIKELTDIELILEIRKCDKHMNEMLAVDIDHYPGAIMGIGDFYVEKSILIDELLLRRKDSQKTEQTGCSATTYQEGIYGICGCKLPLNHLGKHLCYKCNYEWN